MKQLEKHFNFKEEEPRIYKQWEHAGYFKPEINPKGKPYCIILPPTNANGNLHLGHSLYTVEDIIIRIKRMQGFSTLWLPGSDHAGFETQFVYEKKLKKEGKSRFDFTQEQFYKDVYEFVLSNRKNIQSELRAHGFSLDWSRDCFTLDKDIIDTVYDTFISLYKDKLIYKGERVGNYCIACGTAFSDLEIIHQEEQGKLYFIKYPILDSRLRGNDKYITVATTRPETMLGDTAVAVNPKDKKYKNLIGKKLLLPLTDREIPIIASDLVDPKFGTGAVKVTPAHSEIDYEIYLKNPKIGLLEVINRRGRINENAPKKYQGMKTTEAREAIIKDLDKQKLMEKITDHKHAVGHCYKCNRVIEPLPLPQWFLSMKNLAKPAIAAVKNKKITFIPKRFEKIFFIWMDEVRDWPISRQLWFGIRMPVYYCENCDEIMVSKTKPIKCEKCHSSAVYQETDTFDTWFSSGQWPFATLLNSHPQPTTHNPLHDNSDFNKFYPTDVLETGPDIIFFWVARMIMLGLYKTKKIPFRYVYLHGLVRDSHGMKMSKSKGNVVNPMDMISQYGADALRFALVANTSAGADQSFQEEKIRSARNFTTKIWNASRFVIMQLEGFNPDVKPEELTKTDEEYLKSFDKFVCHINKNIDNFEFGLAATNIYEYFWHTFCDQIIENLKNRIYQSENPSDKLSAQYTLYTILKNSLKLMHPFMPFITETIWQNLPKTKDDKRYIMISNWPK